MNYEKKYKEALSRARQFSEHPLQEDSDSIVEYIFPELKESEDEKIRKFLIEDIKDTLSSEDFRHYNTEHTKKLEEALAWLDKQGEKKPTIEMITPEESLGIDSETYNKIVDGCIYGEQKSVNTVEPKFKIGDWIVDKSGLAQQVLDFRGGIYTCTYNSFTIDCESNYHLWTIQDAKAGDVLACEYGWTCIFKTLVNEETFSSYCFMDKTKWFCETGSECHTLNKKFMKAYNGEIKPATKEQRDLLFQKMHESGYTFDFEKKELRKLKFKVGDEVITENEKSLTITKIDEEGYWSNDLFVCGFNTEHIWDLVEQKSAWNEEDNKWIENLIQTFEDGYFEGFNQLKSYGVIDWLKSIKDRVLQKQEWSEEDEDILNFVIARLHSYPNIKFDEYSKEYNWLKSLKGRVQPKHEWGEEDECCMTECINAIATKDGWSFEEKRKTKHWLELLKHRIGKI